MEIRKIIIMMIYKNKKMVIQLIFSFKEEILLKKYAHLL